MKQIEIKRNLLIVNSRDKKSGSTSDFIYTLGENSLEIEAIALKSACIPHTYTNINSTNNTFKVSTGSELVLTNTYQGQYIVNDLIYRVDILAGIYTLQTLLDSINGTIGDTMQFTYNSGLNRIQVTSLQNTESLILREQVDSGLDELWVYLGFVPAVVIGNTAGSSQTATNVPPSNPVVEYTLTIAEGQYTIDTIMPLIVAQLSTVISGSLSWILQTTPPDVGKVQISGATQTWKFLESTIPHLIGFEPDSMSYSLIQNAVGLPDLYGTRNLYVASNTLMNGYNCLQKNGEKTSIVMSIPVCSTQGGIDKWESQYLVMKQYDQSININEFDIKILDDNNNVVPLHSADVVLTFECWCRIKL